MSELSRVVSFLAVAGAGLQGLTNNGASPLNGNWSGTENPVLLNREFCRRPPPPSVSKLTTPLVNSDEISHLLSVPVSRDSAEPRSVRHSFIQPLCSAKEIRLTISTAQLQLQICLQGVQNASASLAVSGEPQPFCCDRQVARRTEQCESAVLAAALSGNLPQKTMGLSHRCLPVGRKFASGPGRRFSAQNRQPLFNRMRV